VSNRPIYIDLSAPVQTGDVPGLVGRILVWWMGQLALLLPAWLRGLVTHGPERAMLHVSDTRWRMVPSQSGAVPVDIDCTRGDRYVGRLLKRAAARFDLVQLVLVLSPDIVLRRIVELPMMPESQVASAIELQLDRLTPFKSEAVRMAVNIVARDPVESRISVDVAVTPRSVVEALEHRLMRLGFKVAAVDVEDQLGQPSGFNLCPPMAAGSSRNQTIMRVGLALVVVLSWYFASAMWTAARERQLETWQAQVSALRSSALRSSALRDRIETLLQPIAVAQAHRPTRVLVALQELTTLLPDSARLTELTLNGDRVDLVGLAGDASSLIAILEESKLFRDVRFKSPVMRTSDGSRDRFEISLMLDGAARQ
jgi:general secretion pathway protein L